MSTEPYYSPADDAELLQDARAMLEYDPELAAMLLMTVEDSAAHRAAQNNTSLTVEHQRIEIEIIAQIKENTNS
jgi:hypothetical protein